MNYALRDIEKEKQEAEFNKIKWLYRTVGCPECRQEITNDEIFELKNFVILNQNEETNGKIIISSKMRILQEKMKNLFEKQKAKGGIIEPKEEHIISLNV